MEVGLTGDKTWTLSPAQTVKDRLRADKEARENVKNSPTRVTDFTTSEDGYEFEEGEEIIGDSLLQSSSSLNIEAPCDITPISPELRRRQRKIKILPVVEETSSCKDFADTECEAGRVVIKTKRPPHLPKLTRTEKIRENMDKAMEHAATGDEDEAIKVYKKALRMADSESTRIRRNLAMKIERHPATAQSIHKRMQEDLLEVLLLSGKIKMELTHLYERQGDYENAIQFCRDARTLYKNQMKKRSQMAQNAPANENDPILSPVSKSSSDGSKSYDEITWSISCPDIDKLAREASKLYDRLKRANATFEERRLMIEDVLQVRQEIGTTFDAEYRCQLYEKAEAMAKEALAVEKKALGQWHPQIADTLNILAALALEQQDGKKGCRDQAIQYLLQGLEINRKTLGKKHPRTGQDYLRMARLYQQPAILGMSLDDPKRRQDEERAAQYFMQAADVFRAVKFGQAVAGSILNDLAVIHVARREFTKAIELLEESMACYEADADGGTDFLKGELSIDVVQVKRNIGECHFNVRQYDAAIKAFVDALNYQRDARRKHDAVNDDDLDDSVGEEKSFLAHMYMMISDESIADTIRRLGKAFAARGLFKEALGIYREAEQIHRSAINEATAMSRGREVPDKQDLLAHTLYCIAEVHTSAKDYDSAMKLFHESMQLRMIADGHRPETRRCNMIHCAMCVVGIANVHYQKEEFSNALKHYIDALHFCEAQGIPNTNAIVKMIDQKRTDTEKMILENPTRTLQMSQLESQAESHRERRNYDKAIACLGKALALRQANVESIKAAKLDPTKEIAATVKLLNKFGQIFEEQGDEQKAKKAHLDAVRLYRKIAGKVQLCN